MYLSEVGSDNGIYAKCVAASESNGIRAYTLEVQVPKFLDAEFRTHRMLSQNSSSSRAVPFKPLDHPFLPSDVRIAGKGMQNENSVSESELKEFQSDLIDIYVSSFDILKEYKNTIHKQHLNRYLEPFTLQKKIITGTEWDNFFNLRLEESAQPEIQEAARCMKQAIEYAEVKQLKRNQWHVPYITEDDYEEWSTPNVEYINWEMLIKLSAARCARISYKNHDKTNPSFDKDIETYQFLKDHYHMTPFEHQLKPMRHIKTSLFHPNAWEVGITHVDKHGRLWSGNIHGFIQHRQMIQHWNY